MRLVGERATVELVRRRLLTSCQPKAWARGGIKEKWETTKKNDEHEVESAPKGCRPAGERERQ